MIDEPELRRGEFMLHGLAWRPALQKGRFLHDSSQWSAAITSRTFTIRRPGVTGVTRIEGVASSLEDAAMSVVVEVRALGVPLN